MVSLKRIVSRIRKFAGFGALLLVLFIAPLVIGCSNPSNPDEIHDGPPPVGKWVSGYNEYFNITSTTLAYGDCTSGDIEFWAGNIQKVTYFDNSETSGVIIIEYISGREQTYYQSGHWGDSSYIVARPGNFEGVYFKNRTSSSIDLSSAANSDYSPAETATLEAAINKFTQDRVDILAAISSTCTKQ